MAVDRELIRASMEVVSADGRHMGDVDGIEGERIKLAKRGAADGQHHFVKLIDVDAVRDGKVWLTSQAAVD